MPYTKGGNNMIKELEKYISDLELEYITTGFRTDVYARLEEAYRIQKVMIQAQVQEATKILA
jgi:hypothetical protein